jgi:hypothetical protein
VIRRRIASLLNVVDDAGDDLKRADDAEDRVIDEVRRRGQEALQVWAQTQVEQTCAAAGGCTVTVKNGSM